MNTILLFKKIYWHFFKTMPCEMILKTKWNEYRKIEQKCWQNHFDIDSMDACNPMVVPNKSIFVYWDKGFDEAPPIVKKCYQRIKEYIPNGWKLIALTDKNVADYVKMPTFIQDQVQKDKIYRANYSDILRTALLYHYGGIWIDSTCLLTNEIPKEIINEKFFMFSIRDLIPYTPMMYESWFIRSNKKNYVLGRILENILYYFYKTKHPKRIYFVWFYILSSLCKHDGAAKLLLDNIPYYNNFDALLLANRYGLGHQFSQRIWEQIKNKSFVQKLTYKYDEELNSKEYTFLSFILKDKNI